MTFIPTSAHEAIFDKIRRKDGHMVIDAKAGSGKTTTIIEGLKHVSPYEKCIFLAFNKSIATELKSRVPNNCEAKTLNGLGHGMWLGHLLRKGAIAGYGDLKLDDRKTINIAANHCQNSYGWERGPSFKMAYTVSKLVGLGKSLGVGIFEDNCVGFWAQTMNHFDVRFDEEVFKESEVIDCAMASYSIGLEELKTIDFDDQLLLPVIHGAKPRQYDRVLVDESQDLSRLQHELISKIIKPDGQLIAVGDPHQAIYGFRGADSSSMERLTNRFEAETFPLSVTYRCGSEIVKRAQKYVPTIEAHENAHPGVASEAVDSIPSVIPKLGPGDLVVCRTTKPAVALCYSLIKERKRAQVLGREIGSGLAKIVRDCKATTIAGIPDAIDRWTQKELARLVRRKNENESLVEAIHDKAECVLVLSDDHESIDALLQTIDEMFSSSKSRNSITLCTVHKSKGLEADRVWILNPHMMPHPMAKKPWEREQEFNLLYVAITRAKNFLGLCAY